MDGDGGDARVGRENREGELGLGVAHQGVSPAEGAAHVVRLCDPAVEIVNGAYYDRDERVDPAPAATEDRTIRRLNKLADLLVGRTA